MQLILFWIPCFCLSSVQKWLSDELATSSLSNQVFLHSHFRWCFVLYFILIFSLEMILFFITLYDTPSPHFLLSPLFSSQILLTSIGIEFSSYCKEPEEVNKETGIWRKQLGQPNLISLDIFVSIRLFLKSWICSLACRYCMGVTSVTCFPQ